MIEALNDRFEKAANMAKRHRRIHLFSHYDADGVASASIVASALRRAGIEFEATTFKTLEPKEMEIVRNSDFECMIMTDMGTKYLDEFGSMGGDCIVLDHHEPLTDTDLAHIAYANCHNAGIDGSFEVCASTMAYLFAQAMGDNRDLVNIAIAGMIGDKQHIGGFKGVNARIVEQAVKDGTIVLKDSSILPSGDLRTVLYECTDPFIKGVSGDREGIDGFLDSCGTCDEMAVEAGIQALLREQGVMESMIGKCKQPRYYLPMFDMDAEKLSRIIDSCGRSGRAEEGIRFCMGERVPSLESTYASFVEQLLGCINGLSERGTVVHGNIQYFVNDIDGITGTVAGMYSNYLGDPTIPVIGFQKEGDGTYSLSSRCTDLALSMGINMAIAMDESTRAFGGNGGGHANAAGGSIPIESMEEFLSVLDGVIGKQRKG